jgi:hypothetical protein
VKDDFNSGVLEDGSNRLEVGDLERVNQGGLAVAAELDQVDAIHIPVERCGLCIERNPTDEREPGRELSKGILVGDQPWVFLFMMLRCHRYLQPVQVMWKKPKLLPTSNLWNTAHRH